MNQLVWNGERKTWVFVAEKPRTRPLNPNQRSRFRKALLERHGPNCWLCNKRILNETPTLDHITPRSLGGRNELANLRLAHERCNAKRGSGKVPELLLTAWMRLDRPQGWKRELIAPIEAGTAETSGSARRARAGSAPDNGEQWVIEDAN